MLIFRGRFYNPMPESTLTVVDKDSPDAPEFCVSRDEAIVLASVLEFYKSHYEEDVFEKIGYSERERDSSYVIYDIY